MIDLVPDAKQPFEIFSQALAPTFFLGAIAGFLSLMESRLSSVSQRTQALGAIAEFATLFLGFALFRFAQESRIGLAGADEYL